MDYSLPLITTLAAALGFALIMGLIAIKCKIPTIVGYLIAGIIIGPYTPGFVANTNIAMELAEIGVMLLMFGVGLNFSLENLLATRKIALPGAVIQIAVATFLAGCIAIFWGWNLGSAFVFGLALSVASTVVLIRALESYNLLGSISGQIAIGWLIVEDLVMVIALVFLPFIAEWTGSRSAESEGSSLLQVLGITLFKLSSFLAVMFLIGRWFLPRLLWQINRTGSRELFTLCVIAVAVSIAFGVSKLFDVSIALGAFFAGMILRESKFSRRAAEESLPFRDAFAVLFFVSVGMLFNPVIFIEQPLQILAVVGIIVIGKSVAAAALVLALRYPLNTALLVSTSLAQIGEFSFILANHGVHLKLLPSEGQELILAAALISISINPFLFRTLAPLQTWLRAKFLWIRALECREDPLGEVPIETDEKYLSGHILLIGYGRVSQRIEKILIENNVPYVIVEQNRELVEQLRKQKVVAVFGDASQPSALIQAHIAHAGMIVVATTSDVFDTLNINRLIEIAGKLNPKIEIAIRVQNEEEKAFLQQPINEVFFLDDEELAKNISAHILTRFGLS